ncbi:MAG TPA: hypothetical protein DHV65_06370, partial [Ktedonobacter sp.]|nr:hypothetical protein [Ktedonobacter sp.]
MLSFASVCFGIGFCLFVPFEFTIAFWLLVASVICDGLDGVEARLQGTNTAVSYTHLTLPTILPVLISGVA